MDEDKKKKITIGIIVACLGLAAIITFATREGGGTGTKGSAKIWVKCANPDCEAEYQITRKEYQEQMREQMADGEMMMMMMTPPALICKECEEESLYIATKCSNSECGAIFFTNTNMEDYPDRCPECGISEMEERRNK